MHPLVHTQLVVFSRCAPRLKPISHCENLTAFGQRQSLPYFPNQTPKFSSLPVYRVFVNGKKEENKQSSLAPVYFAELTSSRFSNLSLEVAAQRKSSAMSSEPGVAFLFNGIFPRTPVVNYNTSKSSLHCSADGYATYSRRSFGSLLAGVTATFVFPRLNPLREAAAARPEGVNRPDLLPKEFTTVIDLERFLASGEIRRIKEKIDDLEKRTGFKIRVLTQRYPQTPGLAVKDYWNVDDNTVVMVADYFGGSGQLIKYNVGAAVDVLLPTRFWSVLSANLGNKFYIEKNGEAASIINSVETVRTCLLRNGCATPPDLNPAF